MTQLNLLEEKEKEKNRISIHRIFFHISHNSRNLVTSLGRKSITQFISIFLFT